MGDTHTQKRKTSSYPVNDSIIYAGISFPTPLDDIDKLKAQNKKLTINVFGRQNERAIVYRLSKKPTCVSRIHLMLTGSGEIWHYSFFKRVSALLHDQTKHDVYCLRCLEKFTPEEILRRHEEVCKGKNERPMRADMPKESEKWIDFINFHKQLKRPVN